jgi:hypothetical protein
MQTNPNDVTSHLPVGFATKLVRTGVIGDGNCMFHAILSSYSNKYIKLSTEEKIKYVAHLRTMLPDMITKDIWLKMGRGETSRLEYSIILNQLLHDVYRFIQDGDDLEDEHIKAYIQSNQDVCRFITKMVTLSDIDTTILPHYKRNGDVYFDATYFTKHVVKFFKKSYGKNLNENDVSTFNSVLEKIGEFFDLIAKTSIENAYVQCKAKLGDSETWVGTEYLSFISDIFSVNIYFIDAKTMMPYVFGDDSAFTFKKSIILLWIDENHFEIVGIVEDHTVRRTFNSDEHIIQMIHAYTVNPAAAIEQYPELKNENEHN